MECPDSRLSEAEVESQESSGVGETQYQQQCRGGCSKRKVVQLEKKIERLEGVVQDRDASISSLKAKLRQTNAELVEFQLHKLQQTLSDKDSALAVMELQLHTTEDPAERKRVWSCVKVLQTERNKLAGQFKSKVNERFALLRQDSDEVLRGVAREYRNFTRDQLCDELRALDLTTVRLKAYIDQLLAVVLESSPCLLEGLPRIQQNSGLKMELFSLASLTELLEELHEREANCQNLHDYASLLLRKLTEQAPDLLDSVLIPKWEELRKCKRVTSWGACDPPRTGGGAVEVSQWGEGNGTSDVVQLS